MNGNSLRARRYRDVAVALAADLGGQDNLSEPSRILVRQVAALTVAGEDIDLEQLTRLSNVLGRTLHRLGLKKKSVPMGPTLAEVLGLPR
jgi:hypothetical protein